MISSGLTLTIYEAPVLLIFLSGCNHPCEGLLMKLPFWVKLSPSHIPSTLFLRFIPVLKLPDPPGLPSAAPALDSLGLALCLLAACREQGPTQTGSQELNTAARLATGPLGAVAPPKAVAGELSVGGALLDSLLELEPELLLDGLRLSNELENFHWGILGMSMQKVVVPSCSPSSPGESANTWAEGGGRAAVSRGGSSKPGVDEEATGVATIFPLMARLCIRSSEEVTESFRKRPYLGLSSMPGGAVQSGEDSGGKREGKGGWQGKGKRKDAVEAKEKSTRFCAD